MFEALQVYKVPGDLWDIVNFGPNRVWLFSFPDDQFIEPFMLSAFITSDFTLAGTATWQGGEGGGSGKGFLGTINSFAKGAQNFINSVSGVAGQGDKAVAVPQIRSPMYSVVDWVGSGEFAFDLSLIFPALTPDEDVRIPIKHLLSCVYPYISGSGTLIVPPRAYAKVPESFGFFGETKGRRGCIGIEIGEWFSTPPIFVAKNVTFNLSKELTPRGYPLYATCTISLKAAVQVGVNHINEWIGLPSEF